MPAQRGARRHIPGREPAADRGALECESRRTPRRDLDGGAAMARKIDWYYHRKG